MLKMSCELLLLQRCKYSFFYSISFDHTPHFRLKVSDNALEKGAQDRLVGVDLPRFRPPLSLTFVFCLTFNFLVSLRNGCM